MKTLLVVAGIALVCLKVSSAQKGFVALFPEDGTAKGWVVGEWNDVSKLGKGTWRIERGVLHGEKPRGTWLMSEKEYGDFILEFEFKLNELGNSGCALRAPMKGDPAFDGMELQMADFRYNTNAKPSELTGGLYRAVAPTKQAYKPTEWNKYRIALNGPKVEVELNGQKILNVNLEEQTETVKRHDGTDAPPLKDRPRKGHIGFQNLSRGDEHVQIRNARIKELN
jgi:hypothetical protein